MKIDFDGIQAFVVIAELGGFNKAAEHLHVTQTALTRRVQKLEAYLGLRLLDRTTRYVELTAVGREFLPQARVIVNEMTAAVGRLKDMSKHAKGSFTLACVPTMAAHILPSLIREYAKSYPQNRIRLLDATSYEVRDFVLNSQAELGIGIHGEQHPDIVETHLFDDPLMFFCRDADPLSQMKSVTWSDMSGADLITRQQPDRDAGIHGLSTGQARHQSERLLRSPAPRHGNQPGCGGGGKRHPSRLDLQGGRSPRGLQDSADQPGREATGHPHPAQEFQFVAGGRGVLRACRR